MIENTPHASPATIFELKSQFRADTDQNGDWWVWRRLSTNGWATLRRCDTREDAHSIAESLNKNPDRYAV